MKTVHSISPTNFYFSSGEKREFTICMLRAAFLWVFIDFVGGFFAHQNTTEFYFWFCMRRSIFAINYFLFWFIWFLVLWNLWIITYPCPVCMPVTFMYIMCTFALLQFYILAISPGVLQRSKIMVVIFAFRIFLTIFFHLWGHIVFYAHFSPSTFLHVFSIFYVKTNLKM